MSNSPQKLTRNQLAEFLPNTRAVRAFEQILKQTGQLLPDDIAVIYQTLGELSIESASGNARAQQALDSLASIARSLDLLSSAPSQRNDNSSKVDYLDFATSAPAAFGVGRLWWDASGTLNIGMGGGNITQQVGEEFFVYGKATSPITEGQLIMVTGAVGESGVITFAPTPTGLTDPNAVLGIATENIALNGFGRVTTMGVVHGINTTGASVGEVWTDGDVLWYNPSVVGSMTKVKPSAPNMKTQVAIVINAGSGGSGSLQVEVVHGSTLGGTDTNVQFGALANGQLVQYDATAGYWKNVAASTIAEPPITAGTTAQYWRGDKTWQDLFAQVRAATLMGLSTATNAVITAADTVLSAFGKLQAQITAHTGASSGVHGVVGNVVGTSDSQTLTNKSIDLASNTLATTSAQLAAAVSDETGSGALVFATRPSFSATVGVGAAAASASGSGVSFPATQNASTDPNTLDDYEEGSCSLTITAVAGSITTSSAVANYTKIGRLVTITGDLVITNNGTGSGGLLVSGLPFTSAERSCGNGRDAVVSGALCSVMLPNASTTLQVFQYDNTYPAASGSSILFSISYITS